MNPIIPEFVVGDFVEGMLGWREYATSDGSTRRAEYAPGITKVDPEIAPISTSLGVLGFPGITAYFALLHTAEVRPGETVVRHCRCRRRGLVGGADC